MKGFVAVLMSYGCLALVAAMIFTTSDTYAAEAMRKQSSLAAGAIPSE